MAFEDKVMNATEADWGFMDDPAIVRAGVYASRDVANTYEFVDREDAEQDALLYLAVSPGLIETHRDNLNNLRHAVWSYLDFRASREARRVNMTRELVCEDDD